jgi:hypothetical protein
MGRKTTAEMVGEAFREFGVLLGVFAPLEQLVVKEKPMTPDFLAAVLIGVLTTSGIGVVIERKRRLER